MDEMEQARERRIGALRQVVGLLRGNRDQGSPEARAGWAAELERLADEVAIGGRAHDSRVTYRNVMAYLRNEMGLDQDRLQKLLDEHLERLVKHRAVDAIGKMVDERLGRYYGPATAKLERMIEAEITRQVTAAIGPQITVKVAAMVEKAMGKGG